MYNVSIGGQPLQGNASEILNFLREQALFFEGDAEQHLEWLACNIRRLHHIFINTAPGKPLKHRQEIVLKQMINHGLVEKAA